MRGLKKFCISVFAFFGIVSAIVQFISSVYGQRLNFENPEGVLIVTGVASLIYGVLRMIPKSNIEHTYKDLEVTIKIKVGDIFKDPSQLVVGMTDTFDTDTTNDEIISADSLQGQMQEKRFGNNLKVVDKQINDSLSKIAVIATEKRSDKRKGKLKRYPIGTVVILKTGSKSADKIFGVAISKMNNDLVAESSVHSLWDSLGQLWNAVYTYSARQSVVMPVLGTGLARINALDRESILRMTLLSFMARNRERKFCKQLTIYIHPSDRHYFNMLELEAFIKQI